MAIPLPDLSRELETRLEEMGFELVEARWVGSARRPILRIRMDLWNSVPGQGGVSVDQCARVSRALEPWLDGHTEIPEHYVLEVSSPGVDRPLTRPRDWERFRGYQARVKGRALPGGSGTRVQGDIVGLEEDASGRLMVVLLPEGGEKIRIPMDLIEKAHLVYRWD